MDEIPLDDAEFLQRAALDYGYIGVNLSLFGVGLSTFLSFHALYAYLQMPVTERKRKGPFVIVIFTILLLFITMATIDSVSYKKFTMDTEMSLPKTSWWQVYDPSEVVGVVSTIVTASMFWMGEAVLLYRCSILYRHRLWVLLFPGLLLVGSFVVVVLGLVDFYRENLEEQGIMLSVAMVAGPACLVGSNTLSTFLILTRLWGMRRTLRKASLQSPHVHQYASIAAILIESALPLAITGILACVLPASPRPKDGSEELAKLISACLSMFTIWTIVSVSPFLPSSRAWL
ncbi:hypothetical protein CC2G_000168 [Coprinopsis cinerea AmutBmut pab1-1]|nr:hypothetical protein CC2G_000168 [Coprinopsis cinerea AmutBmut pab1-1]